MTRRDFEIRAAEFFLCDNNETSIAEQLEDLHQLDGETIAQGELGILVWEPFESYPAEDLLTLIEELADNYEEFYNMTNEKFREK